MRTAVIVLVLCAFACFASATSIRKNHLQANSTMHHQATVRDNYAATCNGISLSGSTISGYCQTRTGSWTRASLELNNCLGNINGVFSCGTNWAQTGKSYSLSGSTLNASLQKMNGSWKGATASLNNFISNINGALVCDCTDQSWAS